MLRENHLATHAQPESEGPPLSVTLGECSQWIHNTLWESAAVSDQSTGNRRRLGCKGQARPCSRSNDETVARIQSADGWSMELRGARRLPSSWGVGEQERALTGDATAMRCADTFHPCRNLHRRSRTAWVMDVSAARGMQRESAASPLPRYPVIHRTSCSRR